MTINVAVKCPEGIVLGADSLVTMVGADRRTPLAFASRYRKLFQVGKLPIGVTLNGDVSLRGGQTVEDIVAEFAERLGEPERYSLESLTGRLRDFVRGKCGDGLPPHLQLIVGGYSRRRERVRYGEVYSITWDDDHDGEIESRYATDNDFGYVVGGRPAPIDRFMLGFDQGVVDEMMARWETLYRQTRDYIFRELTAAGRPPPESLHDLPPPSPAEVAPWSLLSEFELDATRVPSKTQFLARVTAMARQRYRPAFGLFSLPMAVNFAWHLLLIAYAESNFLPQLPAVGSHLTIATITRDGGFQRVWSGEPDVSGRR